jgi:hypothetical protein
METGKLRMNGRTLLLRTCLAALLALSGCATPSTVNYNVSEAEMARCRYETQAAYASARERTVGDMIGNAAGQNHLMRLCLQAASLANDDRVPRPIAPAPGSRVQVGKPVPAFCSDPKVFNPYLRAECP